MMAKFKGKKKKKEKRTVGSGNVDGEIRRKKQQKKKKTIGSGIVDVPGQKTLKSRC